MNYRIKDIELAPKGELLIEWAQDHMPVLTLIRNKFEVEKPLAGVKLAACLQVFR